MFLSQFISPSFSLLVPLSRHTSVQLRTAVLPPLALLAETSLAHCSPHTQALGMPLSAASLCSSSRPPLPATPTHSSLSSLRISSRRQYNALPYRQHRRSMEYELHKQLLSPRWQSSILPRPIKNLKIEMHRTKILRAVSCGCRRWSLAFTRGKAFRLQAWTGPWGSRRLRLQNV